jgi:hypothetical protein
MVDGHLNFDVEVQTKNFNKGLDNINKAAKGLTGTILKIGGAIAAAFSTKEIIEAAAEVKALNAQFEQTFGIMQDEANKAINGVAKSSQILDTRLKGTATRIYAFAKTSGMESAEALNMMNEALQVTADSAAYYDRSLEDVAESLTSFLKGNYANDAALGVSATETTRNAKAMEMYGKKFQDLSEAQKQLTLLQMVKDANELSGAMGQAAREADGWENVTGNLKEAWKQLLAAVGQPMLALAVPVVKKLTEVLQKLTEIANEAAQALAKVFGINIDTGNAAEAMAEGAEDAAESYADMAEEAEKAEEANENSLASFDKVNKLNDDKDKDKSSSSSSAESGNGGGGAWTIKPEVDTAEAESRFEKFFQKIKDGFELIRDTAKDTFRRVADWFDKNFSDIFADTFSRIQDEATEFSDTMEHIWSDLQTLSDPLKDYFENDFTPFLRQTFTTAGNIVTGLLDTCNMVFRDIWDIAVFPLLTSLITDGLPLLTQFATETVLTLDSMFTDAKSLFDQVWEDYAVPTLELAVEIITDTLSIIKEKWDEYGKPIFDGIREAFHNTIELLKEFLNDWIKPVFDEVMSAADELWNDHLAPLLDEVLGLFGDITLAFLNFYNNILMPKVRWIQKKLAPIFVDVGKKIVDKIKKNIASISDALKGIVQFIRGALRDDWSKAWSGLVKSMKAVFSMLPDGIKIPINLSIDFINGIISGFASMMNSVRSGFISLVNTLIDAINSISIDIPDWVPDIGGQTWGWDLPHKDYPADWVPPQIPKLATGTVIPANYGEFLAVLGDNKREAEVVSPISTIRQAVVEALAQYGSVGGNQKVQVVVPLYVNSREIGRAAIDDINAQIRQNGKSPIKA